VSLGVIPHLPFWISGFALAAVPILHWLLLNRALAVSGRFTALVDRLRFGKPEPAPADTDALIAALRAETIAAFGEGAVMAPTAAPDTRAQLLPRPTPGYSHLVFLFGLMLGGVVSAALAGASVPTAGLHGDAFARVVAALGVPAPVVLGFGGVLVGFGTRMAAGCTSGHGLCGVSQLQPGSMVATAGFFGAGIAVSFALGALP
jgi:uncharacterized membrane protein YedE/YeeE